MNAIYKLLKTQEHEKSNALSERMSAHFPKERGDTYDTETFPILIIALLVQNFFDHVKGKHGHQCINKCVINDVCANGYQKKGSC